MRIAFIISSLNGGGAERVVSELANEIQRRGHKVFIYLSWEEGCEYILNSEISVIPVYREFPSETQYKHNKIYHYKKALTVRLLRQKYKNTNEFNLQLNYWKSYQRNLAKAKILSRHLKNNKIDVLFGFMEEPSIIASLCKKFIRINTIISERNYPLATKLKPDMLLLKEYCYNLSDKIVFQTYQQMEAFSAELRRKGEVIFNPVRKDLPYYKTNQRDNVIVNYCRLTAQKNLPLLLKAFLRIAKEYNDYHLAIYGKGEEKENLLKFIEHLGLKDRVCIYPFATDIHNKVINYSMFVMTSNYEGMPNSLLEAMAMGMPVISTDCLGGGARAVIEDGVNGQLVPCNDEDALYIAMKRYIDKPDFAEKCGNNASKIRSDLSVERITDKWLSLVER